MMLDSYAATAQSAPPYSEPAGYKLCGRFVLRRRERLLLRDGEPVELGSRAVEVLLALVEADGALLTKGAIMDRVWPDVAVEENNLQVQVSALRRALGPHGRDWIATVPGRGYRFTGPVAALADGEFAIPAAPPSEGTGSLPLSVLVLPFAGHGSDPARRWFADGVTDSLTTDLARALPTGSAVTAQVSAVTYKDHPADVRAIGREQGVRYVLRGSVLLAEDQVRVNAQLVAAETGAHLWADRFDTSRRWDGSGVLQVQDEIVGRLTRSLGLEIIDAEARRPVLTERKHLDAGRTAQDLVLRAHATACRDIRTRGEADTASILYAAALEHNPESAEALAGVAYMRVYQVAHGPLQKAGPFDKEEARTAAREAHLADAEEKLAHALAIAPANLKVLKARAALLSARGLFADATSIAEAVLARSPADLFAIRETGFNFFHLGRTEEAVSWFQRADALAPADPARWTWLQGLGHALIQLGRDAEAANALRRAAASNPAVAHAMLAAALALAGEDVSARAAMAEFRCAELDMHAELFVRQSAVQFEATDPLYQARNARVMEGLRRAAALAAP